MADQQEKQTAKPPRPQGQKRDNYDGGDGDQGTEPSRAILALHPNGVAVAVAVDKELRVFDKRYAK